MRNKGVDCIIVGQGLAGSAVAIQFLLRKRKVLVIDEPMRNTSSIVAAGLFNPITGKNLSKTWLADELFPYLFKFYRDVEAKTKAKFFYAVPIYRPFLTVGEQNDWVASSLDSNVSGFVKDVCTSTQYPELHDNLGGLLLNQTGFINTRNYLAAVRNWLIGQGSYHDEFFDEGSLILKERSVEYKTHEAPYIIFCNGTRVAESKFFNWLPVRPLKGETLTIRAKFLENVLVNRGVYIVPNGKDQWRVGSTYNFKSQDENISDAARDELTRLFESLVKISYEVISQDVGIRPVTPDRRPILGKHPEHPTVLIFNGMGTKGVSLSPYFSEVLVRSLENGGVVNKEVDISRYKSLYWKSR